MKLLRIIILAFCVSIFMVLLIYLFTGKEEQPVVEVINTPVVDMQYIEVLVASDKIIAGENIKRRLEWKKFSEESFSKNFIQRKDDPDAIESIGKSFARYTLYAGEPIIKARIGEKAGYLSLLLKKGMRAFSIRISPDIAAGGFILPNDRVDILALKAGDRNHNGFMEAETIFRNIKILAIDQVVEEDEDGNKTRVGEIATLELSQENAEILALEQQLADKIILTLRSNADLREKDETLKQSLHKNKKDTVTVIKSGEFSEVRVGK